MTAVIAHRGNSSVAPENTLAAFEAAWRAGADAIELDVQLTADGEAVVIHDDTLDATTDGRGRVDATDLRAVQEHDAGGWFSPAYAGQRVPVLWDVLDLLTARPGVDLLLELKGVWTVEQARRVTEPVLAAGLRDRVVVQSLWPETVESLGAAAPDLRRALLVLDAPPGLEDRCRALGVTACNPHSLLLAQDPGLVERLHGAGLQVLVWTVDEPDQWAAAVAVGVDGIITDRPDRLIGWLSADRLARAALGVR